MKWTMFSKCIIMSVQCGKISEVIKKQAKFLNYSRDFLKCEPKNIKLI